MQLGAKLAALAENPYIGFDAIPEAGEFRGMCGLTFTFDRMPFPSEHVAYYRFDPMTEVVTVMGILDARTGTTL